MNATSGSTPEARCPRCGGGFHCGAQQGLCDCFEVKLSAAQRADLTARWPGRCLCLRCLAELSPGTARANAPESAPG
ncbi:cysteine-rich CWC family protein [Pseudorhodoferax sp.]|uniref:cysteine-rich CWC family protein n=1 Tax=Pseudorhodoferax sp. TaxID=1993553 RepID=UPI001B51F747|nr:cysteine-rich CWC family protein [Pseudorhodoferax sp.]MBP8143872.1 cysteine-rich CWC family protein [Inhella sp.]